MNRTFRSIWNETTRTFIAAAENVRAQGASSCSSCTAEPGDNGASARRSIRRSTIRPLALEQRFMFDGAAIATTVDAAAKAQPAVDANVATHVATPPAVVFVDARVQDKDKLLTNVDPHAEVIVLDQKTDGLDQMAAYLANHRNVGSVQIVTHGWEGNLWLGSAFVDQASLEAHKSDLASIGQALKPGGDILVYACDTAAGADGLAFVNTLSRLTGADVAASDNRTGAGGDWNLEIATGSIEAAPALSADAMAGYDHSLATLTVTKNADDGSAGTLRYEVNNATAGDTITFASSMIITLTTAQGGNLFISKNLAIEGDINGDGTADITLDGTYKTALIRIGGNSPTVTLDGLILEHGMRESDGGSYDSINANNSLGGALSIVNGTVTLNHSQVIGNVATGGGGAGGGGIGFGGGGGSGFNGSHSYGHGGAYSSIYGGTAASGGDGGDGGASSCYAAQAGRGGTSGTSGHGGSGGQAVSNKFTAGGNGGTAGNARIGYVGGGGGSAGSSSGSSTAGGGSGGSAVGGIYVGTDAALFIANSTISQNLGAGGGGAGATTYLGQTYAPAGDGGSGVGGIMVKGTLHYQTSSVVFSENYGACGQSGTSFYASGTSGDNVLTLAGGSIDSTWTPPPTTTISSAHFSNDTGLSSTDFITQTASQTISGTLSANLASGESVKISLDGGSTWNSAGTVTGTDTWSLSGVTLTGSGTLQVKVTNSSGDGPIYSHTYTLDTTAPTITFNNVALSSDTGSSSTDFLTNTASQTITATLSAAPAGTDVVYGSVDNGATWTDITTKASGTTLTWNGATLSGSNTLLLKVTDNAGNDGTVKSQTYTLDTTAPTITFSNLALSSDTGSSSTDLITSTASQTITATLSATPAGTDVVYGSVDNGATWTDLSSKVSGTTLTWNGVTLSGSSTLKLKVTDNAGNDGTVKSQAYTIDTTAPTITFSNLALSNDTGSSSSDFITSTASQTITATLSATPAGTDIIYGSLDNGATWTDITAKVSGTTLTWNDVTLLGSNTLKLKVTDSAGNDGTAKSQSYIVDTTVPTITFSNLALSSDTGSSSTDFITNTASQTITATLSAALAGTDLVYGSVDNGATWTDITTKVSGTTLTWNGATLSGSSTLKLKVSDTAGNDGPLLSQAYVLDTSVPTITFSNLALSSDTGSSSTDFITSTASQTTTATLSATPAGTDIVYGSLDNGATWTDITAKVSGTTLTWDGLTLSGSSTLKLKITDNAGNDGTVKSQAYDIDATAPAAPSAPTLTTGTDTGSSHSDGITNQTTPTFTGTAETGSTVTLYDTDGVTVLGTAVATGGSWSITSSTLSEGSHTVTAKTDDAAGNASTTSSGLTVTVDTTPPTTPEVSATTIASTTTTAGAAIATLSATDSQTITYSLATGNGTNDANNSSFTIEGNSLKVGGTALTAGTYHLYVAATDTAGNASYQTFTLTVVDGPSVSSIVRTGSVSATVATAATSVQYTVTFDQAVTGVDASDFSLTATGTAVGTIAGVSGSGTTYTVTVSGLRGDGSLRLDLNGSGTEIQNASSASILAGFTGGATYTLDHTAPSAPNAAMSLTSASDSGISNNDRITHISAPTLRISLAGTDAVAGDSVELLLSGSSLAHAATATLTDTDIGNGYADLTITTGDLGSDGGKTFTARVTDAAGNVGTAGGALTITLDTTPPAAPGTPDLTSASDSGRSATDNITNVTTPTFNGTAEAGSTVALYEGTTVLCTGTADGSGHWSITSSTLSSGTHTITVKTTDAAGNVSAASSGLGITIDTATPATPSSSSLASASDTGTSSTDHLTKVTNPTLTGTAPANSTITLYDTDGTTVIGTGTADGSGNWSVASSALAEGSHTVTAKATSVAGNTSVASSGLTFVIDTTAPAITFSNLALSADTGASSSDFVTRTAAQTITATLSAAPAASDLVYGSLDGGATWTDITGKVAGTTLTWNGVTLSGSNSLMLKVVDAAGNEGTAKRQSYALDTVGPAVTVGTVTSASTTPILSGTASEGATLTVTVGGASYSVATTVGTWTLDLATAVPVSGKLSIEAGRSYAVAITAADAAGNASSASGTLNVIVITRAPNAPAPAPVQPASAEPVVLPTVRPEPAPHGFLSAAADNALGRSSSVQSLFDVGANAPDRSVMPRQDGRPGTPTQGSVVQQALADRVQVPAGKTAEISLPAETFAQFGVNAHMQFLARQTNGLPLPNWISFDPVRGKFVVKAPPGVSGELLIRLTARDAKGHEKSTTFTLHVGTDTASKDAQGRSWFSGRASLSDQFRNARNDMMRRA